MRVRDEDTIPSFCWDRKWSVGDIKRRLEGEDSLKVLAFILREAKFAEVWDFVTPGEVRAAFEELAPYLGRKRDFWRFILDEWRGLGKI